MLRLSGPEAPSAIIQTLCLPTGLAAVLGSPLTLTLTLPLSPQGSGSSALGTLLGVSPSGSALPHPYNKLLLRHAQEQSCPFLCIRFLHSAKKRAVELAVCTHVITCMPLPRKHFRRLGHHRDPAVKTSLLHQKPATDIHPYPTEESVAAADKGRL